MTKETKKIVKKERKKAFKRSMNRCQICGLKKKQVEIHHIDGWNQFEFGMGEGPCGENPHDAQNYMVLCHSCHMWLHARIMKNSLGEKSKWDPLIRRNALKEIMKEKLNQEIKEEKIRTIYKINKYLLTLDEIGKIFNLSRSRISQILKVTKQK